MLIPVFGQVATVVPTILSALSMAGAPAATPVICTPSVPQGENGWAQWAPTEYIELKPEICDGLHWLDTREEGNEPFMNWVGQAGVSGLVMLHEATHIAGDHDETSTECEALKLLPDFLAQYLSGDELAQAERSAVAYDSFLPPIYHEHTCS